MKNEIEILMADGCTKSDAEKHLRNGSIVFDDFEENFELYMKEWDIDEEEILQYQEMISRKKPLADWGIVQDGKRAYYIMYVL